MPTRQPPPRSLPFGGLWTEQKLNIVEKYLKSFTTALKDQTFNLMYIDAFAGTGLIAARDDGPARLILPLKRARREFLEGSALRAMRIKNKRFDRLIWIEQDIDNYTALCRIRDEHNDDRIQVYNTDANDFLSKHYFNSTQWRGVLLLDPFGTQVQWATIERIARLRMLDMWILFPVWTIERMLPRTKIVPGKSGCLEGRLNAVYGCDAWNGLYRNETRLSLFDSHREIAWRERGARGLTAIYKNRLRDLFGSRFLDQSLPLKNSKNRVLFELMFCVGHPNGIPLARRIARHLVRTF